jgi:hypothetical protein
MVDGGCTVRTPVIFPSLLELSDRKIMNGVVCIACPLIWLRNSDWEIENLIPGYWNVFCETYSKGTGKRFTA